MRVEVPAGRWPRGSAEVPGRTLPDVWVQRWATRPQTPVLVDGRDPGRMLDGVSLEARTARVAAALVAHGVAPGDRVLWCAQAGLDSVVTLLAVLRSGAVVVPVSPSARAAEVAHVVRDATPTVAVCDHPREPFGAGVLELAVSTLVRAADAAMPSSPSIGPREVRPEDDALIVYTSGTTGSPKGAVHTHASLLAGVTSLLGAWEWVPEDRLLLCLPLFHVHGLVAGLFGTLTAGASALVFERFDESAVLDSLEGCSLLFGVPTMYHRFAATGRAHQLSALRLCVSGSAPLAADLWHRLAAEGVAVLERYGMTETLLTLSNPLDGERRPGSVGVPLPGVAAALHDVDDQGVGELHVRAPAVCRDYWSGGMQLTDGWFATGDLVSVAGDGYVSVRGRRTELIITGGHNVYPAEVEAVLARYPGVHEVAVVGVPSEEWGESVVAYVVGDADLESLHAFAATELAPYKCPRQVHVVDALPRNALGKVLRTQLR